MSQTPIVESLKAWQAALEAGDIHEAIAHHDAVTAHIIEHKDSAVIFKAAEMSPGPFVEWAKIKKTLGDQMQKGRAQMQADFDEATEQVTEYLDRIKSSNQSRDVIRWVGELQNSLQGVILNAAHLDMDPEPDEIAQQLLDAEKAEEKSEKKVEEKAVEKAAPNGNGKTAQNKAKTPPKGGKNSNAKQQKGVDGRS